LSAEKFVSTTTVNNATKLRPVWIVPVVNPLGTIKYVRVSQLAESTIVQVEWVKNNFGDARVRAVSLRPGFAEQGWSLLADDFHDDNLDRVWERFRQWMLEGPMCQPGGKVAEWPAKYLPSSVTQRRTGKAPHLAGPPEIVFEDLDAKLAAGESTEAPAPKRSRGAA